jgi:hypothetical protein
MITKQIKMLLVVLDMTFADLARLMGTSPQNLNSRVKKDNWRVSELERIAQLTGSKLVIELHAKTGEIIRKES